MKWIIGLFVLLPAVELYILLLAGKTFGALNALLLIILTGVGGAIIARRQGLKAYKEFSESMRNFQAPGDAAINGLFVLAGAIFVILPGFITDVIGLLFLFAPTRKLFKPLLYRWIRKKMKNGQVIVMKSS